MEASNQPQAAYGPNALKKKRKQLQHTADIVFTKGTTIQTVPSLSKQLQGVAECILGLQFVWEYRSPSKSVPPHYQCKLCNVYRLQHDMVAHVKGWKHCFRFLKKVHPDKIAYDEEEATKVPAIRKIIKETGTMVEKCDGRGQIKVILKEPYEIPAFKGLHPVASKSIPPPDQGMGHRAIPFRPKFSGPRFPGDFPPMGGPHSAYQELDYEEPGFGGYSDVDMRPYPGNMGPHPNRSGGGFAQGNGREGNGNGGLLDNPGQRYPDQYSGVQMGNSSMNRQMDQPMERPGFLGALPENSNPQHALLYYLDTFRIENENDAQLVLKVTQKLTDVLMDYRLRSVSAGSNPVNSSMSSSSFSYSPSRLSSSSDRYSNNLSGPLRYSDHRPRFYK